MSELKQDTKWFGFYGSNLEQLIDELREFQESLKAYGYQNISVSIDTYYPDSYSDHQVAGVRFSGERPETVKEAKERVEGEKMRVEFERRQYEALRAKFESK